MACSESPELPLLPASAFGITIFSDRFRLSINRSTLPINRCDGDIREFFIRKFDSTFGIAFAILLRQPISKWWLRHEIEIYSVFACKVRWSIYPRRGIITEQRFLFRVTAYFRKINQMVASRTIVSFGSFLRTSSRFICLNDCPRAE